MQILIYTCKDMHGNTYEAVVGDHSDTMQLCGMKGTDGKPIDGFESSAYHASDWADKNRLELILHTIELDLDKKSVINWNKQVTVKIPTKRVHIKKANHSEVDDYLYRKDQYDIRPEKSTQKGFDLVYLLPERFVQDVVMMLAMKGAVQLVENVE